MVRWRGFALDVEAIQAEIQRLKAKVNTDTFDPNHVPTAPYQVQIYLASEMNEIERPLFLARNSTKEVVLNEIAGWKIDDNESNDDNDDNESNEKQSNEKQSNDDKLKQKEHPAATRAKAVLEARIAKYLINLLSKLVRAGRLHPDLKVIGALSGRMSGAGHLNITGIPRTKEYRKLFNFNTDPNNLVIIGDFSSLEVAIAAAAYNDNKLTEDLLVCYKCGYKYNLNQLLIERCPECNTPDSRQKVHGLMGTQMYPGHTYEQVIASKGSMNDMYSISKNCIFSLIYGGDYNTLVNRYSIPLEVAQEGERRFLNKYRGVALARQKVFNQFCGLTQPNGIGTQVIWRDPAEKIESLLGFPRYFSLENQICKELFRLANDPPKVWREIRIPIMRRDRIQLVGGAVQSALYGAAFGIQSTAMRAAANHVIQSTGAGLTKRLQVELWNRLQPSGIAAWGIMQFNVHDEIVSVIRKEKEADYKDVVLTVVSGFQSLVPLLAFDYKLGVKNWSEK